MDGLGMASPISIVMTVRDRWPLTKQALESLEATTQDFDLTIIDDASREENSKSLVDWIHKDHKRNRYTLERNESPRGVGGSKNQGIERCRQFDSKYVCSVDNDIVFKPQWLEILVGAYEAAKYLGYRLIGGGCHPFNRTNKIHECFNSIRVDLQTMTALESNKGYTIHEKNAVDGLCHFMDWETWDRFGPYDAHAQGVRQSEDFAFCRKIVDAGFKVGVVYPHVIENHGVVDTFGERIPGAELVEKELAK